MKTYLKHSLATVIALGMCIASAMAQAPETHIVSRGETLKSIAEHYGTTTDAIIELNPEAAQLVYVGMELTIPAKSAKDITPTNKTTNASTAIAITQRNMSISPDSASSTQATANPKTVIEDAAQDESELPIEQKFNKWELSYELGYGFLKKEKGLNGNVFAMTLGWGANYYVVPNLAYLGARLGWSTSSVHYKSRYNEGFNYDYDYEHHFISLPIELGFRIGKKFAIVPYASLGFNLCIVAKHKIDDVKVDNDLGGKVGIDAKLGGRLSFNGFNIGAAYVMALNDNQKFFYGEKGYMQIAVACGF